MMRCSEEKKSGRRAMAALSSAEFWVVSEDSHVRYVPSGRDIPRLPPVEEYVSGARTVKVTQPRSIFSFMKDRP
jgi:hypothetical protein